MARDKVGLCCAVGHHEDRIPLEDACGLARSEAFQSHPRGAGVLEDAKLGYLGAQTLEVQRLILSGQTLTSKPCSIKAR